MCVPSFAGIECQQRLGSIQLRPTVRRVGGGGERGGLMGLSRARWGEVDDDDDDQEKKAKRIRFFSVGEGVN